MATLSFKPTGFSISRRLSGRGFRFALAAAFLFSGASILRAADSADNRTAADVESVADNRFVDVWTRWDSGKFREYAQQLDSLPEAISCRILWLAASAPDSLDNTPFFIQALASSTPSIRRQTADVMIARDAPDSARLLAQRLETETDADTVRHIVSAMSRRPPKKAIPLLMSIMQKQNVSPDLAAAVGQELRRITRAELADTPNAWRDWWLDNAHRYE